MRNYTSTWVPILFAYLLILLSCKKYLDIKSDSSLVVPTTLEDLQKILDNESTNNLATPSYGEASSDDYYLLQSTYNGLFETERDFYTWKPTDYNFENDWSLSYSAIYNANLCLDRISDIEKNLRNELQWNNAKGSALFYRAYHFLNLAWVYSKAYDENTANNDLGIVLRLNSDFNIPSVRSSVKETYDRIIYDTKEAASLLPPNANHVIHPSKAAAYGLLARTYLSMRKYEEARKYADSCLQISHELLDFNSDVQLSNNVPFQPFNKEIIFYTEMNNWISSKHPVRAKIDTLLYSEYHNNDLRKSAFFRSSSGLRFKGNYTANISLLFSGIAADEMYLVRAECNARGGKVFAAMNDLNLLLIKRWKAGTYIELTASTPEEAVSLILLERRKELLMRGLRWIDIKRLNKENANITPVRLINGETFNLLPNARMYALPLPTDLIQSTSIQQN